MWGCAASLVLTLTGGKCDAADYQVCNVEMVALRTWGKATPQCWLIGEYIGSVSVIVHASITTIVTITTTTTTITTITTIAITTVLHPS